MKTLMHMLCTSLLLFGCGTKLQKEDRTTQTAASADASASLDGGAAASNAAQPAPAFSTASSHQKMRAGVNAASAKPAGANLADATPSDPYNLLVSPSATQIDVRWDSDGYDTAGFLLSISIGSHYGASCLDGEYYDEGIARHDFFYGLDSDSTYTIAVCAYDNDGNLSDSLYAVVDTTVLPPVPPANLHFTSVQPSSLRFDWNWNDDSATNAFVAIAAGSRAPDCTTGVPSYYAEYTFTDLQPNTKYTVSVCNHNAGGYSQQVWASATTLPPPQPTANLALDGKTGTLHVMAGQAVTFSWSSTNGDTATSTYYAAQPNSCGMPTTPTAWSVNTLSGTLPFVIQSCQAGTVINLQYNVFNSFGLSAQANLTLVVSSSLPPPPAASITFGGQSDVVHAAAGDSLPIAWSSTGGATASSTYMVDSANACGFPVVKTAWVATSLSGGSAYVVPVCLANHSLTLSYTVVSPDGQSTTATTTLVVSPLPAPTASFTVNGQSGSATAAVGDATILAWKATNGAAESSTYFVDGANACGYATAASPWAAASASGSANYAIPLCMAGHTLTWTYTVVGADGQKATAKMVLSVAALQPADVAGTWTGGGLAAISIAQSGAALTIGFSGQSYGASFISDAQISFSGNVGRVSADGDAITWSDAAGTVVATWTRAAALNPPDISGVWSTSGVAAIAVTQSGSALAISFSGQNYSASFVSNASISFAGNVGQLSADGATIAWYDAHGTLVATWTKSQQAALNPPDVSGAWRAGAIAVSIVQHGASLALTWGGQTFAAVFVSDAQIALLGATGTVSADGRTIAWRNADGSANTPWTR